MSDVLEKLIDQAEAARLKADLEFDHQRLVAFTEQVEGVLRPEVREALGLTYGLADGLVVAEGQYRGEALRLDNADGWQIRRRGGHTERICSYAGMVEQCLLLYLAELRIELDTAAAAPEISPALTRPELFALRHHADDSISLVVDGGTRWFSDVGRGLAGWLNDYVAPIIQAAQVAYAQADVSAIHGLVPIAAWSALADAVAAYEEIMS